MRTCNGKTSEQLFSAKRAGSFFLKGGHSATQTEIAETLTPKQATETSSEPPPWNGQ